jgi:hypothetical protein
MQPAIWTLTKCSPDKASDVFNRSLNDELLPVKAKPVLRQFTIFVNLATGVFLQTNFVFRHQSTSRQNETVDILTFIYNHFL